jgi:MFS transporter, DHA2 family, multidrug resistance protein
MSLLALAGAIAIPALLINEALTKHPLLKLSLLKNRNFAFGVVGLFVFLLIGLSSSQIPQLYLREVQGYRPLQSGVLTLEIAAIQLIMLPAMAMLLNVEWVDARWVSAAGLLLILVACLGGSGLVGSWTRQEFFGLQALQAVGQPMVVMSLLMMGTNAVAASDGPFAAALINIPRALAEAGGACVLDLIVRFRGALHTNRLEDTAGLHRFAVLQQQGLPTGPATPLAAAIASPGSESLAVFAGRLSSQSTI